MTTPDAIALSVLICSTNTRWQTFGQAIQQQIWGQYDALTEDAQQLVEILMLTDNKQMMLGHKRNIMVDAAQGRYVVFVDDDDRLEPDYLVTLLEAATNGIDADVITFLVSVSLNGAKPQICRYSKDFKQDRNLRGRYERMPNHICAVKRELATKVAFPNQIRGEDAGYAKLLRPLLRTQHSIERVLYHYDFDIATTETQTQKRAPLRTRPRQQHPFVDVVILSNANERGFAAMTQDAIDTCIAGANGLPVNVIVMEQQAHTYRHATTVRCPGKFNYNAFANRGAAIGDADWLMIANNDLIFSDGWLHALLAANASFVSPKCPRDPRQSGIEENTSGYMTGTHMSGWCFMLRRELWEEIGGFDDCVDFWCSDDVVIEQVKAVGVIPMLVPGALVEHIQSVTLRQCNNRDDLTWRNIEIFGEKYGPHRLSSDRRFRRWKAKSS